jgi:hypothetical protein
LGTPIIFGLFSDKTAQPKKASKRLFLSTDQDDDGLAWVKPFPFPIREKSSFNFEEKLS